MSKRRHGCAGAFVFSSTEKQKPVAAKKMKRAIRGWRTVSDGERNGTNPIFLNIFLRNCPT